MAKSREGIERIGALERRISWIGRSVCRSMTLALLVLTMGSSCELWNSTQWIAPSDLDGNWQMEIKLDNTSYQDCLEIRDGKAVQVLSACRWTQAISNAAVAKFSSTTAFQLTWTALTTVSDSVVGSADVLIQGELLPDGKTVSGTFSYDNATLYGEPGGELLLQLKMQRIP